MIVANGQFDTDQVTLDAMDTMISDHSQLSPHEQSIVREIARHVVEPGPVQVLLNTIGLPFEKIAQRIQKANNKLAQKLSTTIDSAVRTGIERSIRVAGSVSREHKIFTAYRKAGYQIESNQDIEGIDLSIRDQIADRFDRSNAVMVGAEGAVLGAATSLAEALPAAQLVIPGLISVDIVASTTLLSRHLVQLAAAYGFGLKEDRSNIMHVLAAMVPQQFAYDEGFLPVKIAAMSAAREAGGFAAKVSHSATQIGFDQAMRQLGTDAPQLIKLVNYVAEKLGLRMSQKAFGILVPLVGGAVNGSLNVAFQQAGHTTGKDYFRLVVLSQRHGEEAIRSAVQREISTLRRA
ncbi:MAG: EcsC family protein [bacterium]|nr:EcsC family protein [bacterium]